VERREKHAWPYPEAAVRTCARNYAEAVDRLTGSVQRRSEIGDVTVHPVTLDRVGDWLRSFDHDARAAERPWSETRAAMIRRFRAGTTFGYLAYVDGRPVGWANASLRADYGLFKSIDPEGTDAGHFRGPRSMYDVRGFAPVAVRERDTVMRTCVG
jgi:hypothetical protein